MRLEHQTQTSDTPLGDRVRDAAESKSAWPDAWLINAVRRDPPDEASLNTLIERYWRPLYARCRMLTLDADDARDLAQESWLRVLRVRHTLRSDGNFKAYLMTIATNLSRDMNRAAVRAGAMASNRVASFDAATHADEDESITLANVLADPRTLSPDDQLLLQIDLDKALARLDPRLRDVLVARFINGESALEIGRRYNRTEQAITGWIRQAIRQMKILLDAAALDMLPKPALMGTETCSTEGLTKL